MIRGQGRTDLQIVWAVLFGPTDAQIAFSAVISNVTSSIQRGNRV